MLDVVIASCLFYFDFKRENMKHLWSKFNFLVEYSEDVFLLYNSYSNNLLELDKIGYEKVMKIKEGDCVDFDEELVKELVDNCVLVYDEDVLVNKIKLARLSTRFTATRMNLTIAPTVACNFACPYCYEEDATKNKSMQEDVEDRVISLIRSYKGLERLNVDWYGGEPLLVFDNIVRLTKKIQSLSIPEYKATIITNGYLLDEEKMSMFKDLSIYRVQVTMDGMEEMHNKRRPHKTNMDSFERISKNLSKLHQICPDIELHVRVNIDKDNADDFFKLNNYLHEMISSTNFFAYPAYVTDFNPCKVSFCMMNRVEQTEFVLQNSNKYPFAKFYYPITKLGECTARFMNSYVMGPEGELYKCWCDVGDASKVIGNLKNGITNSDLYTTYMCDSDPLNDEKCLSCSCFPICNGGCAFRRLKNKISEKKDDLCTIQKGYMDSFIKLYYESFA
jgi:radical SAM additional 4Fe4S-binding domain